MDHFATSAFYNAPPQHSRSEDGILPLRIVAKLHPKDVRRVLAAISASTGDAWLEGKPAGPNQRPLLLRKHPHALYECARPTDHNTDRVWGDLYQEGMVWRQRGSA